MSIIGAVIVENPKIYVDLGGEFQSDNIIFCEILKDLWDYNDFELSRVILDQCGNAYMISIKYDKNKIQSVSVLNQSKICEEARTIELTISVDSEDYVSYQFVINGVSE